MTKRYDDFCAHCGMVASRNTPGEAHENGAVEAHNNHLKVALDQALILRGFLDELVARRNRRRETAVRTEMAVLRPLPVRRTVEPSVRPLAGSVCRDGLFPRSEYAEAWAALSAALPRKEACRHMVDLLWLAHDEGCVAPEAHLRCDAELAALIADSLGDGSSSAHSGRVGPGSRKGSSAARASAPSPPIQ